MIPVAYGLLGAGRAARWPRGSSSSTRPAQTFEWELPARPVPSLLRGFSAPVILERADDRRPSAPSCSPTTATPSTSGRRAGRSALVAPRAAWPTTRRRAPDGDFLAAARGGGRRRRASTRRSRRWRSALPSEEEVIAHMAAPAARARSAGDLGRAAPPRGGRGAGARRAAGGALRGERGAGPLQPRRRRRRASARCGRGRSRFLTALDPEARDARAQFAAAGNMTERMAALALLVAHGQAEAALAAFHADWRARPAGRRQVVLGAGGRHPARAGGGDGRAADPASGLRLEEPQPAAGA